MELKIIIGALPKVVSVFIIFLAISLIVFSARMFVADMQVGVANHALAQSEIKTARLFLNKAVKMNPLEKTYKESAERLNYLMVLAKRVQHRGANNNVVFPYN